MYGKVKLTKRQIKEDKFTGFMLNLKHQFMESWQYFVIGLIIVILLITAVFYYKSNQEAKDIETGDQYSRALLDYRNGEKQMAILGLSTLIESAGNSKLADQATFLLGKINLESRNYTEATRYFEIYLNKFKNNKVNRAASKAGIGTAQENQGQYAEAAIMFKEAFVEDTIGPLASDYQVSALRNYLYASDFENAKLQFGVIKRLYEGTTLYSRAARIYFEYVNK